MDYKTVKYGRGRERLSFSKVKNNFEVPSLLEVQKKSYNWFLTEGIEEVFRDLFPVENFSGTLSLEIGDFYFEEPRYSIKECKDREATYSAPLMVEATLFINGETEDKGKAEDIFMGDIPLMTDSGSFIINGAERVVVSQLVRSPSIYFSEEMDKNGKKTLSSQIIPNRGTWLEFEVDAKNVLYVRIDRTRKVTLTTLLRAFGLSKDEDIKKLYGENVFINNTLEKDSTRNVDEALLEIYEKLRPGEPATLETSKNHIITRFFDQFKYDLAKVGRYKYNKKLFVADRLLNQKLAEDIIIDGKTLFAKGTIITKDNIRDIRKVFKDGYNIEEVKINEDLDIYNKVQTVKIYNPYNEEEIITLIGTDPSVDVLRLTVPDLYASVSYFLNLLLSIEDRSNTVNERRVGRIDQIDHLANRRVKQVGELLQNQFRIGVSRTERAIRDRMTTQDLNTVTAKSLINVRPITAAIKEFFGSSQLSQFMDQVNPISELTHKRRLSALGPGGLSRERAGAEVRDVNESHYGRICPIESPEGPNIGLITSLATYAKVDDYGFLMTPYRKVVDGVLTDEIDYLTADEEEDYYISIATVKVDENNKMVEKEVPARYLTNTLSVKPSKIDYVDVSPQQIISVTTSCIPFLEHNDAKRTLMGANMQRQAVPLISTEAPIVGTGIEYTAAKDSGACIIAKSDGVVDYVDAKKIVLKTKGGKDEYHLANFELANAGSCKHQVPAVKKGDVINKGDVLADGPSTNLGEIALGKNVVVAFTTFEGYNYEDAVVLNERLVKDDVYTSIKLEDYEMQCRDTKLGPEEITRDIPNVSEEARKHLDENGIVVVGTEVREGDILVGKVTPKGMVELTAEEKLLHAIFGEKAREVRDTSLRLPHGTSGIVHDVKVFSRENGDDLPSGISQVIRVYIAQKRKIQVGDKMAGRYGNKGVISLVLPEEDMPFLPDGTPVDVMLNPQGVPSRMNLGQILELHLGMAAKKLNLYVATPNFDGARPNEIKEMLKKAGLPEDGKTVLYDGRTGEAFDHRISVGVMYMLKLNHMVDDKIHARATGPYSLVTQQPLGGKSQFGGQRFGEMEVWALEAYGASNILQEILTVKSDDVVGRVKVYESIIKGEVIDEAGIPESFRVLMKELQALGLEMKIINPEGEELSLKELETSDMYKETVTENVATKLEENEDEPESIDIEDDEDFVEDEYMEGDME